MTGPTEGLALTLDGRALALEALGEGLPVDPGNHVLSAVRAGEEVARAEISVSPAGTAEATLDVPPLPLPSASLPDETDEERAERALLEPPPSGGDEMLWLGIGIGAGALVVGAAVVLAVVLAQPAAEMPFQGNLGSVEIGVLP